MRSPTGTADATRLADGSHMTELPVMTILLSGDAQIL